MADWLTPWSTGSSSSEARFPPPADSNDEDDPLTPSPERDFFKGVRRGIKRFGSAAGPPQRPKDIHIQTDEQHSTAPTPDLIDRDASRSPRQVKHVTSASNLNREKPLPKTPLSPPVEQLLQKPFSPPDTPKVFASMSRPAMSGSRTSTMDSSTSGPPPPIYTGGSKPSTYTQDMASSQGSFASSSKMDGDDDPRDIMTPRSNGQASAGPSPAQARPSGGQTIGTPAGSSTHLSGLMCNVHRTTGREPHPLVGATTTILGDKLYVFGGRILSRTRPLLTSDLYELDLIRRHWTKVETSGDVPPPRYFHSVCPLGDTKLVCYGGMSPSSTQGPQSPAAASQDAQQEVVVMSDIHIYDAPTKTWHFIPTVETPQGRYAHCATILPSCATFSAVNAASSALHHNPPGSNPNQGSIGVNIDGSGGAEMVVVGGQDSANHYIEQISVFNLRSLKWTSTQTLGKSCGAYRSMVAPLPGGISSRVGKSTPTKSDGGISQDLKEPGSSMLIYSNYNFLDVKLELQIRSSDGTLSEKPMGGTFSPPGLRFPNGGVIDMNFVVSGTYLTSSKQEYALWALDLRSLTWSRIDAGGNVFSQGSWNRGVLWNRRNTFVILGNRKRSLVEDYNHRRINFTNVCMVELEAFGLYDNPRKATPMSGFISASSPFSGPSLSLSTKAGWTAGGRAFSKAAEELGQMAMGLRELADMDILCIGGERIPVNSRVIARRWGPYFVQLLREGAATQDGNDAATLRPETILRNNPSRNSSVTITPSLGGQSSTLSTSSTLQNPTSTTSSTNPNQPSADLVASSQPPDSATLPPTSRPRTLYLPHTQLTLQALLYYLYTSSLPLSTSPLCTPQILCSLLQLARPYQIDGLLESVVERLHGVLDSRNAAAVFNATAMAAGGGRSTSTVSDINNVDGATASGPTASQLGSLGGEMNSRAQQGLRINTQVGNLGTGQGGRSADDEESLSASSSVASDISGSDISGSQSASDMGGAGDGVGEIWRGDVSAVIGLQKRGLRGLMEGRRLRERGASVTTGNPSVGLGIGRPAGPA